MMNLIRVGDDTDHGGKVETDSATMCFGSRYVAGKGDRVFCPRYSDVSPNVIKEGDSSMTDEVFRSRDVRRLPGMTVTELISWDWLNVSSVSQRGRPVTSPPDRRTTDGPS